jgi:hypothetical protein
MEEKRLEEEERRVSRLKEDLAKSKSSYQDALEKLSF